MKQSSTPVLKSSTRLTAVNIEALTMIDMAVKQILPAVIEYTGTLSGIIQSLKAVDVAPTVQSELLRDIMSLLNEANAAVRILRKVTAEASGIQDNEEERAHYYHDHVMPAMEALRSPIDSLEMLVDKEVWPMPSYGDLMFEV